MSKEAKYFCEFCDTEVEEDAKECPKCGRVFSSVVCSSCGYSGAGSEFVRGCPKCGNTDQREKKLTSIGKDKRDKTNTLIPWWVYFIAGIVLGMTALYLVI